MADFMDYKGPSDTYAALDEKYGTLTDPTIRLDFDYPSVSRELAAAPTDEKMTAHLKKKANGKPIPLYAYRYRNSPSGNLHVELDLAGPWKPSEMLALRSLLGDDDFRVLCDSRRALENPVYLGGYINTTKWIPGDKPEGGRGSVMARATEWKEVVP